MSLVIPAYFLRVTDWSEIEVGPFAILIPLLYVAVIVGFIFLTFGKSGRNAASIEADKKIVKTYGTIQKKLRPVWWLLAIGYIVWMAYLPRSILHKHNYLPLQLS